MSDLMAALYGECMKVDPNNPHWEERDWLVVSKGHCGPAVYGTLALMGYFPEDELETLNKEGNPPAIALRPQPHPWHRYDNRLSWPRDLLCCWHRLGDAV